MFIKHHDKTINQNMESKASGEFRKLRMEQHRDKQVVKQETFPSHEQTYKLHEMMQFGKCLHVKIHR